MKKYVLPLLRMPTTWLGIAVMVAGFAIAFLQPIQVATIYWTGISNAVLSLILDVVGAIIVGLNLRKVYEHLTCSE